MQNMGLSIATEWLIDGQNFQLETFDEGSKLLRFLAEGNADLVIVGTTRFGLNALESVDESKPIE